jgi:hypothetical protein
MAQPAQPIRRMSLAAVKSGRVQRPLKTILYGVAGIGKTTFAAGAPSPIFLCAEDGTAQLDVHRFPEPTSWQEALDAIDALKTEQHEFKTLVVDTLDWLEPLCWRDVCRRSGKPDIEAFGYGKGYVAAVDEWRVFLARLEALQRARGMHVLLLAHGVVKQHRDPSIEGFQRWTLKLHEKSAAVLTEWCDALLFATHETYTKKDGSKTKGISTGARVVRTSWHAAYEAKNRFGLPDPMPLDWETFASARRTPDEVRAEITELLPHVSPDIAAKATEAVKTAGDDVAKLSAIGNRLSAILNKEQP